MEMTFKKQTRTIGSVSVIFSVLLVLSFASIGYSVNDAYAVTYPKRIGMFMPSPTVDLFKVINNHLDGNDVAMNFRVNNLNQYTNQERLLLAESFDAINTAISTAHSSPKPITYIAYDNEASNGGLSTPSSELVNPGVSTNAAADMVHKAGYKFAATPTRSILLKEYQQVDWTKVDLLVMQLQKVENNQQTFTNIATEIATYVSAHNPNTAIFVQVNPNFDTVSHIVGDIKGISGLIDGMSIVCSTGCTPTNLDQLYTGVEAITPTVTKSYAPQAPTGLTASASSTSQVNLNWSAPTNNGGSPITGYKIERSTDGGSTWSTIVPNSGSTTTTYSNTGLTSNTSYTYRVSAINAVGSSSPSNIATATTPIPVPPITPTPTESLRFIMFPPSMSTATLNVLKTSYQAGDGIISSRVDNIVNIQDNVQAAGLEHYILAPRIGPIDSKCGLGPVEDVATFVSQAQQAKTQGYDIDAILYDIEGWCWTPTIERQNFVASVDQEAQIAHAGGFKSGIQPTHDLLVQNYKQIHFQNQDFLLIQFQKYLTSKSSGYTQMDSNYYTTVQDIINTARSQNPNITIFIQYNLNWSPESVIEQSVSHFASQIQGVSLVDLPPNDSDMSGVPFPNNNTAENQAKLIAFVKSM